ncbi:MAG TPA: Holliday junction branch migration protein RuvA [Hellea balneolensis]|uniref:Holliday junction branch migration complex subunit RuvA n=1 Tax=Hellea balneolensis TaxID=287478 RepID=A0A7V5NXG3_9PROT|nr:Holliday junction branch migration protein RuvA [Hellea balneolensis]
MIGMLTGTVAVIGTDEAILDVNGVGYLVKCGSQTLSRLSVGAQATLHIETHVREQAITLFGFADEEARAWFVRLQSVQKVGPKAALAILDILSPAEILSAAAMEDKATFARASGVGPSLAARIVMELSGKPPPQGRGFAPAMPAHHGEVAPGAKASGLQRDAVSALCNLGIDQTRAMRAVANALSSDQTLDLNQLVKSALKDLNS